MTATATATATAKVAPTITTVTMDDGQIVEFVGKKRLLKTTKINAEGQISVRMDFLNGEVRHFNLPATMVTKAAAHGIEQKLGDEIAGIKDIDDAVLALTELVDRLEQGDWNTKVGEGLAGTSILARALAEFRGLSIDKVKAYLKDKTAAQKAAMRNASAVKVIVDRLEAEKAAKAGRTIDADALLADLS